jgi:hypothetical protein
LKRFYTLIQLVTVEDVSAASDELLRSCGIPGGQILRIKAGIDQFLGNAKPTKVLPYIRYPCMGITEYCNIYIKLIINH